MDTLSMFVAGKRRLTNAMLSDLRAAGFYAGRSAKKLRRRAATWDRFAAETDAIRRLVSTRALELGWRRSISRLGGTFIVSVRVTGHPRHDPDAWYLLAKAAIDGLVDAAVLKSDRKQIEEVRGKVHGGGNPGFFLCLMTSDRVPF